MTEISKSLETVESVHPTSCGLIMRIGMGFSTSGQCTRLSTAQSLGNTLKFSSNTSAVLIFLINGSYKAEQIKQD